MVRRAVSNESHVGASRDGNDIGRRAVVVRAEVATDVIAVDVGDGATRVDVVVFADVLPFWLSGAVDCELGEAVMGEGFAEEGGGHEGDGEDVADLHFDDFESV